MVYHQWHFTLLIMEFVKNQHLMLYNCRLKNTPANASDILFNVMQNFSLYFGCLDEPPQQHYHIRK